MGEWLIQPCAFRKDIHTRNAVLGHITTRKTSGSVRHFVFQREKLCPISAIQNVDVVFCVLLYQNQNSEILTWQLCYAKNLFRIKINDYFLQGHQRGKFARRYIWCCEARRLWDGKTCEYDFLMNRKPQEDVSVKFVGLFVGLLQGLTSLGKLLNKQMELDLLFVQEDFN